MFREVVILLFREVVVCFGLIRPDLHIPLPPHQIGTIRRPDLGRRLALDRSLVLGLCHLVAGGRGGETTGGLVRIEREEEE